MLGDYPGPYCASCRGHHAVGNCVAMGGIRMVPEQQQAGEKHSGDALKMLLEVQWFGEGFVETDTCVYCEHVNHDADVTCPKCEYGEVLRALMKESE